MRLYANADDAWPSNPPANADRLLRTASRTVDAILLGRCYAVDDAGMPTDADVAQALTDAAVAIALELAAAGTLEAGASQQWQSVSIGNVSLSNAQAGLVVDGIPVPPAAIVALQALGPAQVWLL